MNVAVGNTQGLAFSPDGKMLASGHGGHEVQLWDMEEGKVLGTMTAKHNRSGLLAFSPLAEGILTGKYLRGQPLPENSRFNRVTKPGPSGCHVSERSKGVLC